MLRTFNLQVPADTAVHSLYALMLTDPEAVPTDGVLPDRCQELTLITFAGNIVVSDVNGNGKTYAPAESLTKRSSGSGNRICLRDYYVTGAGAGAEVFTVELEYW